MKKILFGLSVFFTTLISAQNYPDYYPNNNNGYYDDCDDEFYFPEDYYYEYPSDYYRNDLYQSYYRDYQRSIYDVNWNRFFKQYRLSPWQIREIMLLNDQFPTFASWNSYYRYNPDRWYYDRFYALERILGTRVYVIYQNNYYNGYNPVNYWQNYRRQHYVTHVYVVPRYRNINVNRYRVNKVKYHQANPRQNIGFQNSPRTGNGNWNNATKTDRLRNDRNSNNSVRENGFRNGTEAPVRTSPRISNGTTRNNEIRPQTETPRNNGGFRDNNSGIRNTDPQRKIESNSGSLRNQTPGTATPGNTTRMPGQRLTSL